MGEKWLNEIASQGAIDEVGQEIKKSKVSYRVRVKVLGSLSRDGFVPGLKRIPQITSKVRHPDRQELGRIIERAMTEQESGVHIGDYDLDSSIRINFESERAQLEEDVHLRASRIRQEQPDEGNLQRVDDKERRAADL